MRDRVLQGLRENVTGIRTTGLLLKTVWLIGHNWSNNDPVELQFDPWDKHTPIDYAQLFVYLATQNSPDIAKISWRERTYPKLNHVALEIAFLITQNTQLKSLDLNYCAIAKTGMITIINALKTNTALTEVVLTGNYVDVDVLTQMLEVLETNTTLSTVRINPAFDIYLSPEMRKLLKEIDMKTEGNQAKKSQLLALHSFFSNFSNSSNPYFDRTIINQIAEFMDEKPDESKPAPGGCSIS